MLVPGFTPTLRHIWQWPTPLSHATLPPENCPQAPGSDPAVDGAGRRSDGRHGRSDGPHPAVRSCCEASKRPGGTRQTRHGRHDGQNYGLIFGKPQKRSSGPSGRLPMTQLAEDPSPPVTTRRRPGTGTPSAKEPGPDPAVKIVASEGCTAGPAPVVTAR
ncbi:hypothetical protein FB45DRAFT_872173 [Roridomyces roridus]|uniref:Uncharacterized protein n=1 Tax=Roridomyces roridus TaxID=1738132 RepID=A0AAD7BEI9_9AGAR|nr:hypothetical protein FB45DRAFT_872173 [Roridomyces roridus]